MLCNTHGCLDEVGDVGLVKIDVGVRGVPKEVTGRDGEVVWLRRVRGREVVLEAAAHLGVLGKVGILDHFVFPVQ